jgi:hypothetical protein
MAIAAQDGKIVGQIATLFVKSQFGQRNEMMCFDEVATNPPIKLFKWECACLTSIAMSLLRCATAPAIALHQPMPTIAMLFDNLER